MQSSQDPSHTHTSASQLLQASTGQRIVAFAIDALLASLLAYILPGFLGYLVSTGYLLLRDALPFGQGGSLGKQLMRIRVTKMDGTSIDSNWEASAKRNALFAIPVIGVLLELFLLVTREEGRFGDQWAETQVVIRA